RAVEQFERLLMALPGPRMNAGLPAQVIIVRIEVPGGLALGALDFRPLKLGRNRADDALGHLVLELEDVLERAVETVGPQMRPARRLDELRRDAHAVGCFAHAAFEHISNTKLATDLLHVRRMALVGETRVARDHEQIAKTRQRRNDILDDAVREILLPGVAT